MRDVSPVNNGEEICGGTELSQLAELRLMRFCAKLHFLVDLVTLIATLINFPLDFYPLCLPACKEPYACACVCISDTMVGKKKRGHPDVEELLARPWCYYCKSLQLLLPHRVVANSFPKVSVISMTSRSLSLIKKLNISNAKDVAAD